MTEAALPLFLQDDTPEAATPPLTVVQPEVRDSDLLERMAKTTQFDRSFVERSCIAEQARRDALAAMSPAERRRAITQHELANQDKLSRDNLGHIHSVLAICSLPITRRPIHEREWNRSQGKMKLSITAGKLLTPDGEWENQPLPFGSRARLLLIHACSEAIRNKSPVIEIDKSLSGFIRSMGFTPSGGKNGTLTAFREQIKALAACNMTIGTHTGQGSKTLTNAGPFSSLEVWNTQDKTTTANTITLDPKFFKTLSKHALPLNMPAVKTFANSPRKLDIMCWIGHRIHCLDDPLRLTWENLFEQFGEGYNRFRNFKRDFAVEMKEIQQVFPKLPVKITEKGAHITPAPPEVLYLPSHKKGGT